MFSTIQPHQYVALRLPSDAVKVEQILPNTLINLGKYGSFHANQIIGRPFHLTFEILDRSESTNDRQLRIVPAAELHADALLEETEASIAAEDESIPGSEGRRESVSVQAGKSNVNIIDNPLNQKLTMAEIEALKESDVGNSKDLIAKIISSSSTLEQKTAFSLAKYTLRKNRKYMRRFCVLPLDVVSLADWMMNERDFAKVLEIRNEALGLIGSWANVHASGISRGDMRADPSSRYLVVDDTGGLIVAMLAERMGILHQSAEENDLVKMSDIHTEAEPDEQEGLSREHARRRTQHQFYPMSARSDSITLVHANSQPNLALLRYFSFDSNNPTSSHPLYSHLKTLSWLQLLEPESDPSYQEPEAVPVEVLSTYKSSKRSGYYRKRRRWERIRLVIDETRAGGFNGLILASFTSPVSILRHLVPLLAGGSQVVVYSPHVEPLVELADLYSTARRTAFINTPEEERQVPCEDFPVDPTLLLSPMVQTARVRRWQVLPGRTHPLMMGKGGAEGYLFVATRVLPAEGKVSARGRAPRRKKADAGEDEAFGSEHDPRSATKKVKSQEANGSLVSGGGDGLEIQAA